MAGNSRFAEELNKMLEQASMSVEDVTLELRKHNFPVPPHTFSYWLQGYFLPRSEGAFQLVSVLESIYGITDHRFSDALLQDLSSGASFVPGESAESEFFGTHSSPGEYRYSRYLGQSDKTMDWEANLIQKAVRDEVHVSASRMYDRLKTTVLARIPSVPNPTFILQFLYEPGESPGNEDFFYDISGMTLRRKEVSREGDMLVCASQFSLPDDVVPGDLHTLSYSWDEKLEKPREKIGERLLPWTLDFYSCKVTFEGGIPENIRYVTYRLFGSEEVEVPNDIPIIRSGNTVSISTKNFGDVIGAFCCPTP